MHPSDKVNALKVCEIFRFTPYPHSTKIVNQAYHKNIIGQSKVAAKLKAA